MWSKIWTIDLILLPYPFNDNELTYIQKSLKFDIFGNLRKYPLMSIIIVVQFKFKVITANYLIGYY